MLFAPIHSIKSHQGWIFLALIFKQSTTTLLSSWIMKTVLEFYFLYSVWVFLFVVTFTMDLHKSKSLSYSWKKKKKILKGRGNQVILKYLHLTLTILYMKTDKLIISLGPHLQLVWGQHSSICINGDMPIYTGWGPGP